MLGNLTVYICKPRLIRHVCRTNNLAVGNPNFMHDETKELTLRVHDECALKYVVCKQNI